VTEAAKELMTIRDLAERWGVSVDTAKKHVRRRGVPFFQIGTDADMLVNWKTARFRLEAVRQWEQQSERVFAAPAPEPEPRRRDGRVYRHTKMR